MRRVIIFLIFCLASVNISLAGDYGAIVCPFSYLKKTDTNLLYSKNLEEIFANDLINELSGIKKLNAPTTSSLKNTFSTNPQINSGLDTDEKIKLLAKVYGTNRVIKVVSRYDIKSLNANLNSKALEKMTFIKDDTTIRLRTDVYLIDVSDNKVVWSNTYLRSVNFESVNNKDLSVLTNYYEKLALTVVSEISLKPARQNEVNVDSNKSDDNNTIEPQKPETIELHHTNLIPEMPKNSNIKPVFQLQENVSEKLQPEKKAVDTKKENDENVIKTQEIKENKQPQTPVVNQTSTQTTTTQKWFWSDWGKQTQDKSKNSIDRTKVESSDNVNKKSGKQTDNIFSRIRNTIQVTPASNGVQKEIKSSDIKTTTPQQQPTYTNIHVTPRKNSRNYTPQFNNSVNDI